MSIDSKCIPNQQTFLSYLIVVVCAILHAGNDCTGTASNVIGGLNGIYNYAPKTTDLWHAGTKSYKFYPSNNGQC
jgi:hypothetical protein